MGMFSLFSSNKSNQKAQSLSAKGLLQEKLNKEFYLDIVDD